MARRRFWWLWRAVWIAVAIVLFENGLIGIHASLRQQYDALGPDWVARIVASILALCAVLLAIGPSRVSAWFDHFRSAPVKKVAIELRQELGRIRELATVKQSVIERGEGASHERGFRFPDTQWMKYRELLTDWPAYYDPVSRAYSEVDRVNANISWLEGQRDAAVTLGLGPAHDLPRLIREVGAAINASEEVLAGRVPAALPESERQSIGKTGLSDAEIEGLEKRFWAIKEEDKHQELSALLESGFDLRAQIEELQTDPSLATTSAAFSVSQCPHKIHTWLKDAQLYVRKGGAPGDFTLVRSYRTPSEALEAIDATLQALGTISHGERT